MGIAALDSLLPGTQASTLFFLPELSIKLLPVATVVYAKKNADMLNYYGLRFDYTSQADREAIGRFIHKQLKSKPVALEAAR